MIESKVAGVVGAVEYCVSLLRTDDGEGISSALEALRAFNDECTRFMTISLRSAGPSKGCLGESTNAKHH